jgi:hypothetical protein
MLAPNAVISLWLPAACVVIGLALLGTLIVVAARSRKADPPKPRLVTEDELDRLKRAADRAALLTAAAEKAADALDERIAALEGLLKKTVPDTVSQRTDPDTVFDLLTQAVYDLADAGRSPVEIAGELHEHTGKIELILNLRKR